MSSTTSKPNIPSHTLQHFIIEAPPHVFRATVHLEYHDESDGSSVYRIRVGGATSCIYIMYDTYEDYAYISKAKHDANCVLQCLDHTDPCQLERSQGTVKLIKTALLFTIQQFPKIKGFTFYDHSTIDCKDDVTIDLAEYYIAKHGKTWYEKKLNARLFDDRHHLLYTTAITNFKNLQITNTPDHFYDQYVRPYEPQIRMTGRRGFFKYLRDYFNKHMRTYPTYATMLREMINAPRDGDSQEPYDCIIFQKWLSAFIQGMIPIDIHNLEWVVPRSVVDTWTYDITVIQNQNPDASIKDKKHWGGGGHGLSCNVRTYTPKNIRDHWRRN